MTKATQVMEKLSELKASQKSLKKWTKQEWTTPSGKKSSETGEVYLPKKKIQNLKQSKEGRQRLSRANSIKRKGYAKGQQFTRHGEAAGQGYEKKASVKDELKVIVKELQKASKMHKGQSERIDKIVAKMTLKKVAQDTPESIAAIAAQNNKPIALPKEKPVASPDLNKMLPKDNKTVEETRKKLTGPNFMKKVQANTSY